MTTWPSFTDPQFLDANGTGGMNQAMGTVSGAVAAVGSGVWTAPGLISPEAMTVSFSGLVANVGLPQPWGLIASSGTVVRAHGTQTGASTTNYSVNFAPLVPGSGSQVAYLAATIAQIQQNPFPIPGPPQGDPAYNPNFVPTAGYATNQYTVALSAVSGGIDNVNTFELFRTTLSAGQSNISTWSVANQVRAADRKSWPEALLASGGVLTPAQAQSLLVPSVSGLTSTLPSAASVNGLLWAFSNPTNGPWTIAASGTDTLFNSYFSGSSMAIPASGALMLWSNGPLGGHQIMASVTNGGLIARRFFATPGSFSYSPSPGTNKIIAYVYSAGGAAGGSPATGAAQNSFGAPGGGGGFIAKTFLTAFSGQTFTVGTGGAGVAGSVGGNGGSSSFSSIYVEGGAGGGAYGPYASTSTEVNEAGGLGAGTPSGGDFNAPGVNGGNVQGFPTPIGSVVLIPPTVPGPYPGVGGGGGGNANSASLPPITGANGQNGLVIVEDYT